MSTVAEHYERHLAPIHAWKVGGAEAALRAGDANGGRIMLAYQIRHIAWWYWLATLSLLAASLSVWTEGIYFAIVLTAWQYLHFALRDGNPVSFPAQIRFVYLGLLALGLWSPFHIIHYVQLVGTTALVLAGYCPLARTLLLMPWNRRTPFTLSLARLVYLTPPVRGSILQILPAGQLRRV